MPGAYAHITLVNMLREPQRLEQSGFPAPVIKSVLKWFKFCELGAVSPDYPYLALFDKKTQRWADLMHYERSGELIHAGLRRVRSLTGVAAEKCTAWLLGYASHVVTDVTIHPVVERKVGPYAQNKTAHRVCEMHQDAFIYQRLNLGGLRLAEHLKSGIGKCGAGADQSRLDDDIATLWRGMLEDIHSAEAVANPPKFDEWHRGFRLAIDKVAESGGKLWPAARHVGIDAGVFYPGTNEINIAEYIQNLKTPDGVKNYDDIFDSAIGNVTNRWSVLARALVNQQQTEYLAALGNWNLDTGRDVVTSELVFWKGAA